MDALSRPVVGPRLNGQGALGQVLVRVLAGAVMLMAAMAAIGRPMVFSDTDDYYAEGRSIVRALDHWVSRGAPPIELSEVHDRLTDPADADEEPVHNQDGARSPYYGLFLYVSQALGSLWLTSFLQATVVVALVHAAWRLLAPQARPWTWFALMALLCLGSSLPVFTGFAMPDVFAGCAALATVLLIVYGGRFGWPAKLALWCLLAASLNFHASNLLTCLLLAGCGLAALAWLRTSARAILGRSALVLSAAAVAVAAMSAYGLAIKLRTGDELGRPPFLMARVLADGPGRTYLRQACAHGSPYALCAFRRLPLNNSEDILWADEPNRGVFNLSSFATRQRLEHEQMRFAVAAVASDPTRQFLASLKNFAVQFVDLSLDEALKDPGYYLRDPYWKTTNLPGLIQRSLPCAPRNHGCAVRMPAVPMAVVDGLVALAALFLLGWRIIQDRPARPREPGRDPVMAASYAAAILLAAAVVINAGVCGALSGPFGRYQARIVWLLPMAAALVEIARRSRTASAP